MILTGGTKWFGSPENAENVWPNADAADDWNWGLALSGPNVASENINAHSATGRICVEVARWLMAGLRVGDSSRGEC